VSQELQDVAQPWPLLYDILLLCSQYACGIALHCIKRKVSYRPTSKETCKKHDKKPWWKTWINLRTRHAVALGTRFIQASYQVTQLSCILQVSLDAGLGNLISYTMNWLLCLQLYYTCFMARHSLTMQAACIHECHGEAGMISTWLHLDVLKPQHSICVSLAVDRSIHDSYFNTASLSTNTVTPTRNGFTYFSTLPPRDCSGSVAAIELCYRAELTNHQINNPGPLNVFDGIYTRTFVHTH
jgi:hypothetical protein